MEIENRTEGIVRPATIVESVKVLDPSRRRWSTRTVVRGSRLSRSIANLLAVLKLIHFMEETK